MPHLFRVFLNPYTTNDQSQVRSLTQDRRHRGVGSWKKLLRFVKNTFEE
jgi:hypothetical protein